MTGDLRRRGRLSRGRVLLAAAALALACSEPGDGYADAARALPHVVLVLADDLGYGDISAFNSAARTTTPNIDALAQRGMIFVDAHSPAATCAPTRYSVMTGNYPFRGRHPNGTWIYNQRSQILPDQDTIGDLMHRAGYHSAMVGKHHLGGEFYRRGELESLAIAEPDFRKVDFSRPFGMGPRALGFDYSFLLLSGIQHEPFAYFENDQLVGDQDDLGVVVQEHAAGLRFGLPDWKAKEAGPNLTRKAVEFIDRHFAAGSESEREKPLFLYYSSQAIHLPIEPADEILGTPVAGITVNGVSDFIYEFDVTVGKLVEALARHDALADTLFLVTSDNGALPHPALRAQGHDPNAGLAGWKGTIWEGGHRVPFIAAWGDGRSSSSPVPPGTRSDRLIGLQDLYATLAALTHQKVDVAQGLDSRSFLPALTGQRQDAAPPLLGQGFHTPEQDGRRLTRRLMRSAEPSRMLRDGRWKLIVRWAEMRQPISEVAIDDVIGLYDLTDDPLEASDLKDHPVHEQRIRTMLDAYRRTMDSDRSAS